jgi:hypothetical protein
MLARFHRLGLCLWRWRMALWALCVLSGFAVLVAVLGVPGEEGARVVLAALAVLMWAVCLLMTAYGFSRPVPTLEPGAGWLARLRTRLRRLGLHFAALLTSVLTLLVAYTSMKAILMLLRGA